MSSPSSEDFPYRPDEIESIIAEMESDFEKDPLKIARLEFSEAQDAYLKAVDQMMMAVEKNKSKESPAQAVDDAEENFIAKINAVLTQIFESNPDTPLEDVAIFMTNEDTVRRSYLGNTGHVVIRESIDDESSIDDDDALSNLIEMLQIDLQTDDDDVVIFQIHLLYRLRDEIRRYYRELIGDIVVSASLPKSVPDSAVYTTESGHSVSGEAADIQLAHTVEAPIETTRKRATRIGKAALGFVGGAIAANYIGKRFKNI